MLLRLRAWLNRPVAWGAVLLSYLGIFIGFGFAVYTYDASRSGIQAESKRADAALVETGRTAIGSSCDFDNKRARELRGILERSIKTQTALHEQGQIPDRLYALNVADTRESLNAISFRNCAKEASVLSTHPKE